MTGKPDAVSALLACAESLRAAARTIESLELGAPESRADLRDLISGVRRAAFVAVSLGAIEIRAEGVGTGNAREPAPRRVVM